MFGKDLLIKKYPYLAYSPNLMEYFGIIGYTEKFVPQILDSYKKKRNDYSPKILSSVTSSTDFGIVDNNLIISQIYPQNPLTILINKNDINHGTPPTSNVIYSFCFDSQDGKEKLFYICYSFKFYEKYRYTLTQTYYEEYYIPKAFCIISQYYYFSFFQYICQNIYTLMCEKENVSMPVELTIYNIVNFIPSPINYGLHLNLFGYALDVPDIELGQLSGYPYLDFDLSEIFNFLPLNLFLEIFTLSFVEQSILFFSSNLELLNMVMFIVFILNYPCNDSTYFWHIVSVSKENMMNDENRFVGKLMTSLLGVHCTYNDDIDTSSFGKYHYIVDIDNKRVIFKQALDLSEDDDIHEFEILNNFQIYVQNIIKEKDKGNDNSFLREYIGKLRKNLENFLSKNPDFTPYPKNKYINFFKISKEIMDANKKIQEIFYDFCLNILMIFYQDQTLNSSFDKIKKDDPEESLKKINKLRKLDENTQMIEEEKIFCQLFRSSIKYKIYFENFIQNLEAIDVFKIPLLFSQEFINIKLKDDPDKLINNLSLFSIIDSLYYQGTQQMITITLNNIFSDYLENLKKYFKHFYSVDRLKILNSRQLISLNKKILNKYIYLLNNYEKEELMDLFPSMRIQEDENIIPIHQKNIFYVVQNTLEQNNLIEISHYLVYALVYIFSISISLHSYSKMLSYINSLIKSLEKVSFFINHYIYIIFKTFYKYYLLHKKYNNKYPEINISNLKMYYYMLVDFLKDNSIIPNEEMMGILTQFFSKIIFQERESIGKKKDKEMDDVKDDFQIKKNENFICYMKYCFTSKKYFKPNTMVNAALKEKNICNICVRTQKKVLQPTILIKINDYTYSSAFFSPKKIYKLAQNAYNDFIDNADLDISKLDFKNVRDVILNLIQYGIELNKDDDEFLPVEYLIYTLYLFKDY